MNYTQQQLLDAIYQVADKTGHRKFYEFVYNSGRNFPELVKTLVYDMSINDIDVSVGELAGAGIIIKTYCRELKNNGFVEFEKES